jgi:hypothetical protein
MILKLKDVVELTDLASKVYRGLHPEEYVGRLAPSLGLILQRDLRIANVEVSFEFLNPIIFLSSTYFREPIKEALKIVNTALQGVGGASVLSLTHAMGLGKTHFLTLLYHLYVNIIDQDLWTKLEYEHPDIQDILTKETNYKLDVARKTLIIPVDLKYLPLNFKPYEALIEFMRKVFEKKKLFLKQAGVSEPKINDFERLLEKLKMYEPKDAARALCNFIEGFGITIPVLIIIDELYASVVESIMGASEEYANNLTKALIFISALVDELQGREPIILVYASAQQDIERWAHVKSLRKETWAELLKEAVTFFEDRMRRFSVKSVKDVTEEEALEIIKKRIVRFKLPPEKVLNEENLSTLKSVIAEILNVDEAEQFIKELKDTYPFSPVYKDFIRKITAPAYSGELSNAQHLRDLIKISSSVLGKVIDDEESSLVSTAHIEHDDIKHTLQEDSAKLWWSNVILWHKYTIEKARDSDESRMLKGAVQAVYIKSITDNIVDLIQMLRLKPDTLPLENIKRRALHQRELIFSLIGIININKLSKYYHKIFDELENAPYIHVIERSDGRYYLASFIGNPIQMISNIRDEELRKLKDERGELKVDKALQYLGDMLREYELISQFKKEASLNFEFIGLESFKDNSFLTYLDRSIFSILLLSPINVAEKTFAENIGLRELICGIKNALEQNRNKIKHLNMFSIIIPYMDKDTLRMLVTSLAEIKASNIVLEMFKEPETLNTIARQELERRKDLKDFARRRGFEEELRLIFIEILTKLRERLESFAQLLTSSAVQNFTSDYISIFKKIIAYNPITDSFEEQEITVVKSEREARDLYSVIASLPIWIADTVKSKLNVANAGEIKASLENWIKNKLVKSEYVRKELINRGESRFKIQTIKDGLIRGWRDIPVKPISIQAVENAIKALSGVKISIEDKDIELIELIVGEEDLIIKKIERLPPPPPPAPKGIKGFVVSGTDNAVILLSSFIARNSWLTENIKTFHVEAQLQVKGEEKTEILIKGPSSKLIDLAKSVIQYLNKYRNEVSLCQVSAQLSSEISKEKVLSELEKIGLKIGSVSFIE